MTTKRFVIEGKWSGYLSSQQRIVHRRVFPASRKMLRAWAESTHAITYTDGTCLYITVRDCKPLERVQEIKGYDELIDDCVFHNVSSVAELQDKKK
jgi:hypothetical protein